MFEIIPGVLEKEWSAIERKIELVLPFAKSLHVDILDGKFAPNTTFLDPKPFKKFAEKITLELHMMVHEPIEYLDPWSEAGFRRFIGQVEHMTSQAEFVAKAQRLGEVGLAVDSETQPDAITVPFNDLDFLFVMTVKAGFSNQSFMEENLEKVMVFRERTPIPIEVDGGINDQTIVKASQAGANRFVSTGFLFGKGDPKHQFEALESVCSPHASQDVEV